MLYMRQYDGIRESEHTLLVQTSFAGTTDHQRRTEIDGGVKNIYLKEQNTMMPE